MFETKYQHINSAVRESLWHVMFCTKYRYNMFAKLKYKNLVQACLRKAAIKHNIEVIELEVMPDHLHVMIRLPTTLSISKALQILKGGSSYFFFRNHEKARLRYPRSHLWSKGKFYTTVGYTDLPSTLDYIRNQEHHHSQAVAGN
jgi:putative transposase